MTYVQGSHHVTLSVADAQEDVDFHVKILGMRFIKRTVLFDGSLPIYHLYYSNAAGDPSSVVTTFPWAQAGFYGKRGTNQAREVLLSGSAVDGRQGQERFLYGRERADRVRAALKRHHLDTGRAQLRDLGVHDDVLARGDGFPVAVVRDDHLHGRKRYR